MIAAFERLEYCKFLSPAFHYLCGLGTVTGSSAAPGAFVKCLSGSLHRLLRVLHSAPIYLSKRFIVSGVDNIHHFALFSGYILAVNIQLVRRLFYIIQWIHFYSSYSIYKIPLESRYYFDLCSIYNIIPYIEFFNSNFYNSTSFFIFLLATVFPVCRRSGNLGKFYF